MIIEEDIEIERDIDIEIEKYIEAEEKLKGRSVIYDNIDLEVKTLDKILITLFIIISIVFCYAIMS